MSLRQRHTVSQKKAMLEIFFDGRKIFVNGKESKSDITTQAKAASSYIKKIINQSTGKIFWEKGKKDKLLTIKW